MHAKSSFVSYKTLVIIVVKSIHETPLIYQTW